MAEKSRDPVFDLAKFFAMVFVVVGHLVPAGVLESSHMPVLASNVIVGISMPLFFIISGYFSHRRLMTGNASENVARMISFIWPLLAFGVLFAIAMCATGQLSVDKAIRYPFGRVVGGGWFLRTLTIVYLVSFVICRLIHQPKNRWLAFGIVYLLLVLSPKYSLGMKHIPLMVRIATFWMGEVMHMFPYFVFGLLLLHPYEFHRCSWVALGCGVVFSTIILLEGNVATNGMGFYWVSSNCTKMFATVKGAICFFGRTIVGVIGSVFSLWLLGKITARFRAVSCLAVYGTTTLGVYVIHEWLLGQIGHLPGCPAPWWMLWPITFFTFFFCHWITILMWKLDRVRFMFFGNEKRIASCLSRLLTIGGDK